jgi:SAM-dependent methyltransferase
MLDILRGKIRATGVSNVRVAMLEPDTGILFAECFDLVVSCMTLHHVDHVESVLRDFRTALLPGGIVAIADLDKEDGTFHGDAIPAAHAGFDRKEMAEMLESAGFGDVRDITAALIEKVSADDCKRDYPVFLITARTR